MYLAGCIGRSVSLWPCTGVPCRTSRDALDLIVRTMPDERTGSFLDRPRAETRLVVAFSAVLPPFVRNRSTATWLLESDGAFLFKTQNGGCLSGGTNAGPSQPCDSSEGRWNPGREAIKICQLLPIELATWWKDWGFFDWPWMQMLLAVALFHLRPGELTDSCVVAGEVSGFNGDGSLRDELTDSLANRDDDNLSAVLDSSDDERHCKINLSDRECVVAWKDAEHVIRHATKLKVDLHVDTGEQRALFVIHAAIYLKGSSHDYQIRLFVYPENIRSIEFERNADPPTAHLEAPPNMHMRLRFLMTQPPSLMIPKDRPLSPKERSRDLLETLKTLAAVQELDLYLNKFPFVPEHREQLSLLPGIFSSTKRCARPKTDFLRSNPQDMYKGRGAVIYETGATAVGPNATWADSASKDVDTTEQVAPAYTKDGSLRSPAQVIITPPDRKRRRTSESRSPSDVGKRILTTLSDLQNRVQRLEKMLADSTRGNDHTPCRYDSEEQEHIIGHLGDKIDNDMIDVRFELEDKLFDETQQLVLEKVEEQQSQLRKEMEEGWLDEIRQEIKKELKAELRRELAAEVKAELFKDMAQAMMRAACGDVGGKSGGIGSSQSTQSTDSTQ